MAARSIERVCGRSLAGIEGMNPTGVMDVCCECCVLSGRGLCGWSFTRPEEVLSVVFLSVISKPQQRDALGPPPVKPWGKSVAVGLFDTCIEHL